MKMCPIFFLCADHHHASGVHFHHPESKARLFLMSECLLAEVLDGGVRKGKYARGQLATVIFMQWPADSQYVLRTSRQISVVMIAGYVLYVIFQAWTHPILFSVSEAKSRGTVGDIPHVLFCPTSPNTANCQTRPTPPKRGGGLVVLGAFVGELVVQLSNDSWLYPQKLSAHDPPFSGICLGGESTQNEMMGGPHLSFHFAKGSGSSKPLEVVPAVSRGGEAAAFFGTSWWGVSSAFLGGFCYFEE